MKTMRIFHSAAIMMGAVLFCASGCAPERPMPIKVGGIADNEFNPEEWGKVYPLHYESWLKTREPKKSGQSTYRKGWDDDRVVYDRLSELPFSALLYNGWGFGVEYNEPRGHHYSVIDQVEIDPSRTAPGGVCLACKSPFYKTYLEKKGNEFLKAKFMDAVNMLPEKMNRLGPACIDCHKPSDMGLTTNRTHIEKGLAMLGRKELNRQDRRVTACAQCHMTYYVPRDRDRKVTGDVVPPWYSSTWGNIPIENIIKDLLTDHTRIEWVQKVTGFGMPFIRHPEFELYSTSSVHWNAGVSCVDCHMPYKRAGSYKMSDHNVTSPLKDGMNSCSQCHTEKAQWLKKQVADIQDRTASLIIRAGYATASPAKLFETLHAAQARGVAVDAQMYDRAVYLYKNAFLRLVFISAENSTGFHNPSEAGRVLGDSIAFASKSEALLRQMLAKGGVAVPEKVSLELPKYLNGRGKKGLNFKANQMVKDPYNLQGNFTETP